jgi:hypothetical protein
MFRWLHLLRLFAIAASLATHLKFGLLLGNCLAAVGFLAALG